MRSRSRSVATLLIVLPCASLSIHAEDVYGNRTPWTNSDTTIDNLQRQRRANERQPQWWEKLGKPTPAASWRDQQESRRRQQEEADREAYYREDYSYRDTRPQSREPAQPVSYEQSLLNRIRNTQDPVAQETLAFYLLLWKRYVEAIPHLEQVVRRNRSERVGEAALELAHIARANGAQPNVARARDYLNLAAERGEGAARLLLGQSLLAGNASYGIAADLPRAEQVLTDLLKANVTWGHSTQAGRILFKEYYLGAHLAANPAKAIATTRLMRKLNSSNAVDNWQEDRFTEMLIADGWDKHAEEIIDSIGRNHGTVIFPDKAERVARIYLGLDPEVAAYVPVNFTKAAAELSHLARQAPERALPYLALFLERGPTHHGEGAYAILNALHTKQPDNVRWIRLTVQLLSGHYGDNLDPSLLETRLRRLDSSGRWGAHLLGAARFFAEGTIGYPAEPKRARLAYERLIAHKDSKPEQRDIGEFELTRLLVSSPTAPEDITEGLARLEPAAQSYRRADDPKRVLLASLYRTGTHVPSDLETALDIITPAISGEIAGAWLEFAEINYVRHQSRPLDPDEQARAASFAQRAANAGMAEAHLLLARFYREGFGVDQDFSKAQAIYASGIAHEIPQALTGLAEIQLATDSPLRDVTAGFAAAQRAAELGDPAAHRLLADCHRYGWGTPVDEEKAQAALALAN
jgi:TPR repeat protein